MATHGSVRLGPMARNAAYVVAIELMSAAQGLDLRNGGMASPEGSKTYDLTREDSAHLDDDRVLSHDIESVAARVLLGQYLPIARISLSARV